MLPIVMLMLVQDLGPPGDEPAAPRTQLTPRQRCVAGQEELVVCGKRQTQRLLPLPERNDQRLFGPATTRFSPNKSMTVRTEASSNGQLPAPRAMFDFKLDF